MRVLVCGGAGYIGSHVSKALRSAGHEPVVFDNFSKGHEWAVRFGPFIHADLNEPSAIRRALDEHRIEAVVQLAGSINVGESMQDPGKYFANNYAISLNLLQAMQAAGVQTLVFSSTAAVYGEPDTVPIPEDAAKRPINPYGEAKWFTERTMDWFSRVHGFQCLALRYFNAAGADPDGEIGELHSPETHLIPLVLYAGMGLRPPIKVFGTDYPTNDGTAIRDYIHVADLARAHVQGLEYLAGGGASTACNLGSGAGFSVREILAAAERAMGHTIPHEFAPRREGDPPALVAQASKARELLNWSPVESGIESLVETAYRWARQARSAGYLG
jgi:UDP-glucose-4-epimerase GalE